VVFDETPPTFRKRQHPRKGERKKQGARTKVQASKQPKEAGHKEEREPLIIKTSTKSHDAYQLKKEEVNMIKLQA
jgi:hypothetical protein